MLGCDFSDWSIALDQTSFGLIYPLERFAVICDRPKTINMRGGVLHCEAGPAWEYRDGLCGWSIGGLRVDEQIVMRPETQTVEQIDNEPNNDIRAIRLDRFGADRYLIETGASVIDEGPNAIEGTHEALLKTGSGQVFMWPTCPSGRVCPPLRVPRTIKTCEEARNWLAGENSFRPLART